MADPSSPSAKKAHVITPSRGHGRRRKPAAAPVPGVHSTVVRKAKTAPKMRPVDPVSRPATHRPEGISSYEATHGRRGVTPVATPASQTKPEPQSPVAAPQSVKKGPSDRALARASDNASFKRKTSAISNSHKAKLGKVTAGMGMDERAAGGSLPAAPVARPARAKPAAAAAGPGPVARPKSAPRSAPRPVPGPGPVARPGKRAPSSRS